MSITLASAAAVAGDLAAFDAVIDVRSPAEYQEDHLPGAVNWPVLNDDERRIVGTLYVQSSQLDARKVGAALVARNIAQRLEREIGDKPRGWRPLVYCWRGGQRSGSMAWFLGQIGFRVHQLEGGYKAFRAVVRQQLDVLPASLRLHVLAGRTGSGKTRLLHALQREGAQVLDLEALACHRGSVLGGLPDTPQPGQKRFEMLLWQALTALDPARPVFIESESRMVGRLRVPESLLTQLREHGRCWLVEMPVAARVQLLLEDYAFLTHDAERFCRLIDGLIELRGRDQVRAWQAMARDGLWAQVFEELMARHYDPLYRKSLEMQLKGLAGARNVELADGSDETVRTLARRLIDGVQ